MTTLTEKKQINKYVFLFMFVYLVSYVTRINYAAIISEMVRAENLPKSTLSLAVTGAFVTYGLGQIISGFFGDKVQPKKLVLAGLITTSIMNLSIPLCVSPLLMTVIWCVNGFAQAFMWPPLVRLMTALFDKENYNRSCVIVSWGSSIGTILVYLLSPLIIAVLSWRFVFVTSALCGIIMAILWQKWCCNIEIISKTSSDGRSSGGIFLSPLMIILMICIVLQGSLRDGITTWMPSYISETYNLGSIISILTGVVLPMFGIACYQVSYAIYRTKIKNPMTCAGVIFAVGFVSSVVLFVATGRNTLLSVIFCAVLTGCMHGVNLILICMTPVYFSNTGSVSFVSGMLNACTYVGSALSTYGIALAAENAGWRVTIGIWVIIALAGTILCLGTGPMWKKKFG